MTEKKSNITEEFLKRVKEKVPSFIHQGGARSPPPEEMEMMERTLQELEDGTATLDQADQLIEIVDPERESSARE